MKYATAMGSGAMIYIPILYFVLLCVDIYYKFQSTQFMYKLKMFIQFLLYMFRPFFWAIIR
jgi:hypothetical protein